MVNFILDTKYTGVKGTFNYGQTDRNDGRIVSGDLAFGSAFAGGRGHVLLSGNYYKGDRIDFFDAPRDWFQPGLRLLNNPTWTATNGEPGQIVAPPGASTARGRCHHTPVAARMAFGPTGRSSRSFSADRRGSGGGTNRTQRSAARLHDERMERLRPAELRGTDRSRHCRSELGERHDQLVRRPEPSGRAGAHHHA